MEFWSDTWGFQADYDSELALFITRISSDNIMEIVCIFSIDTTPNVLWDYCDCSEIQRRCEMRHPILDRR